MHHREPRSRVGGRGGPLADVAVLDLSSGLSAAFCAKILGDLGASVIKVEPPGQGDPLRRNHTAGNAVSPAFLFVNSSKQSIQADIESDAGLAVLRRLVHTHDVVISSAPQENLEQMGLGYANLSPLNKRVILACVTPFGSSGPYRQWQATPLILNAMGGWSHTCGLPDQEPLLAGGNLAEFVAGAYAATAAVAAVAQRDATGEGQFIDVSAMEATITAALLPTLVWEYSGTLQVRDSSRCTGPSWMMECCDGYVGANVLTPLQWQGMCQLLGAPQLVDDPEYQQPAERMAREKDLRQRFAGWFRERPAADVFHEAQAWRLPFGLVPSFTQILAFEQHEARGFFLEFPHPDEPGKRYPFPGMPFRMSATPCAPVPGPALGSDTDAILGDLLGMERTEIEALRASGVVGPGRS